MQRMQHKGATKLNKADENCEIKQQFIVTEKQKINFMVAPQQI